MQVPQKLVNVNDANEVAEDEFSAHFIRRGGAGTAASAFGAGVFQHGSAVGAVSLRSPERENAGQLRENAALRRSRTFVKGTEASLSAGPRGPAVPSKSSEHC